MATETIGEQILEAMRLRGIATQSQLADMVGMHVESIRRQIRGESSLHRRNLDRVAEALRCQWHESYTEDGTLDLVLKVRKPRARGN